jgi:mRNA interferase MazF
MVVCPITSKIKGSPFEVMLPVRMKTKGCVLASEIRTLDYLTRGVRLVEGPVSLVQEVREIACAVIDCPAD